MTRMRPLFVSILARSNRLARFVLFTGLALTVAPAGARAQSLCDIGWDAPARITADSAISNLPAVAASGRFVNILWYGQDTSGSTPGSGILCASSADSGVTFGAPRLLLRFDEALYPGIIASSGEDVCVTAPAALDTFFGLVVIRSSDGGATWQPPARILQGAYPRTITAHGRAFYIHFEDVLTGNFGVLRSNNAGATWFPSVRTAEFTSIAADSALVHAVGPTFGASELEIGYYFSADSGRRWAGPWIISPDDFVRSANGRLATGARRGLHCVWNDSGAIVTRSSRNGGITWGVWTTIAPGPGNVAATVAAGAEFALPVWDRDIGIEKGIGIRLSNDFGASYCPPDTPTGSTGAREVVAAISGLYAHVAWVDLAGGVDFEIFYRRGRLQENPDIVTRPPGAWRLAQSYPNPTNASAIIEFDVPEDGRIVLEVYDTRGARVATLVDGARAPGRYVETWDGSGYPTGVYLYRLRGSGFDEMRKILLIR